MLDEIRAASDKRHPGGPLGKGVLRRRDSVGEESGVHCRRRVRQGRRELPGWEELERPVVRELEKGSIGFQLGGETIDLVLLVMNEHGMKRLLEDKVRWAAKPRLPAGPWAAISGR